MKKADIIGLSFIEAWNYFKLEADPSSDDYRKIRHGIGILFDIYRELKGLIIIKPKTGIVLLPGGKAYKLEDYYTELELREKKMKLWLMENSGDEEVANPRSGLVE